MANIDYLGPAKESAWRRLAIGSWGERTDPTIYGLIDLDARAMLSRIETERERGVRITVTQLVARAVAEALSRCTDANVVLRGKRAWQRSSIDVFLQVAQPSEDGDRAKAELSGVKILGVDKLNLGAFADRVAEEVAKARRHSEERAIDRTRSTLARLPRFLVAPLLRLTRWLTYDRNWDLSGFGVARDPFGSVAITSVGMLGIETALAPLYPIGGPPILITVGAVKDRPVAEDGQVVVRPLLRLGGTFDHRVVDGYQIAALARELRKIVEVEMLDAWSAPK